MDGHVMLHGHGVRYRLVGGPLRPGGSPKETEVAVRRYLCRRCGVATSVFPRGLLPRLHYTAFAIVTALALWAEGCSSSAVRHAVSPWASSGGERFHGWRCLQRWARAGPRLWPGLYADATALPLSCALSIVMQLSARAPTPTGDVLTDALAGLHFV
ncbi:MAG: hypothetical protein ACI9KE_006650 [Polyangiales bacterium]|jgi:hypothetical protein